MNAFSPSRTEMFGDARSLARFCCSRALIAAENAWGTRVNVPKFSLLGDDSEMERFPRFQLIPISFSASSLMSWIVTSITTWGRARSIASSSLRASSSRCRGPRRIRSLLPFPVSEPDSVRVPAWTPVVAEVSARLSPGVIIEGATSATRSLLAKNFSMNEIASDPRRYRS
ncbi:MAG: hypothetical protein CNCCGFBP_00307 [Fimbriimonadaceae bacterium]|nr:hypothetical protein [Fimbriimonadaceae bacterium]